MDQVYCG